MKTPRQDIVGQNGNEGLHYNEAYHFRLKGKGNDSGFTGKLKYWGPRIAVVEGEEQEFSIVHTMYEVRLT